jgi:hypothetical protein
MAQKTPALRSSSLRKGNEELKRHHAAPKPISVRVGLEWQKNEGQSRDTVSPTKDAVWQFLRLQIDGVLASVQKSSPKKLAATWPFSYRLGRMRALHGAELLPRFIELCETSDILVFDISNSNPNVMFELGLAMAIKGIGSGRVFIFMEKPADLRATTGRPVPSDLAGYFITFYTQSKDGLVLCDKRGFNAALRALVVEDARTRGMLPAIASEIDEAV